MLTAPPSGQRLSQNVIAILYLLPAMLVSDTEYFFLFFLIGKVFIPKQKPKDFLAEEKLALDPELEEALSSASDIELSDLAG